jgi:uncharacterized protein YjbI with pentapeptide repeats
MAMVVVRSGNYRVRKSYSHKNIIKACFYAYIKAVVNIYTQQNTIGDLEKYSLKEKGLSQSSLRETDFSSENLSSAIFRNCDFSFSDLQGTNLSNSDLSDANLSGTNLSGANLSDANLSGTNLSDTNLSDTNLSGANLSGANLSGANLSGANLSGANLLEVKLNLAKYIEGVNFSGADLSKADLRSLDLNSTIFCKPILTDTKMPDFKMEVYGYKRIERMIQLFNQFRSDHYAICAVHSIAFGDWWKSEVVQQFREVNKRLREEGISIRRVFIIPRDDTYRINNILKEQLDFGIDVRYLYEDLAFVNDLDLRKNLLVCKNLSVAENSFTTMMLLNNDQKEESGYISFSLDEVETNQELFNMIWEIAKPFLKPLKRTPQKKKFERGNLQKKNEDLSSTF